jgi:hypothetical protein
MLTQILKEAFFQPGRRGTKEENVYPPNFAEITECRRIFFSANLGVFGGSRRKSLAFVQIHQNRFPPIFLFIVFMN